ncbi:MAG TPA: cobyric acid synthase [Polyangiales bacterium]|jgi:adenosylcobyric acid synthase
MSARTLMVFGTASDVGKSTIVSALCRAFAREGVSVAPFKAQNMARNAYVCEDGGEIGVAQAVQAFAARVTPSIDHNPILLKPEPSLCSQLIVHGRAQGSVPYRELIAQRPQLLRAVEASLARLRARHQLVILEGAGSPAEVNLQAHDIPNLAAARSADAECLLVADIDRGGVFASVLGTLALLPSDIRARMRGLIINKFRGDVSLLTPGLSFLTKESGLPVLGVVPFAPHSGLPDEDSLAQTRHRQRARASLDEIEIAVVDTPCLANFEDVLPFEREPGVRLRLTAAARELLEADLVILAGSKSTVHDLAFLHESGLARALQRRAAEDKPIFGICGGAQLLGQRIDVPDGIESVERSIAALGILPHSTEYRAPKRTRQRSGYLSALSAHARVQGFELHHGRMLDAVDPIVTLDDGTLEGSRRGAVMASMLHRLFDQAPARQALLDSLRRRHQLPPPLAAASELLDPYDALADHVQGALDWPTLRAIALG